MDLEHILKLLHDHEVRCGVQVEPPGGGITVWIEHGDRTEKATFFGSIVGDRRVWREGEIVSWIQETTRRLYPGALR